MCVDKQKIALLLEQLHLNSEKTIWLFVARINQSSYIWEIHMLACSQQMLFYMAMICDIHVGCLVATRNNALQAATRLRI
jgi:hypothetical protein